MGRNLNVGRSLREQILAACHRVLGLEWAWVPPPIHWERRCRNTPTYGLEGLLNLELGLLAESPGRCHSAEEQENKPRNPGRGEESAEEWLWVGAKLSEFCLLDSVFTPEGERF